MSRSNKGLKTPVNKGFRLPTIELRPKDGGDDAQDFTITLSGVFQAMLRRAGHTPVVSSTSRTIIISSSEPGPPLDLSRFAGVHRIQRVPPTESSGRRHTSTVTVAVFDGPQPSRSNDAPLRSFSDQDVRLEVFRASGPGGQHRNKVATGVRLTHVPSKLTVTATNSRSQWQNKQEAYRLLSSKLASEDARKKHQIKNKKRTAQIGNSSIRDWTWCEYRDTVTEHATNQKHLYRNAVKGKFKPLR